MSTRYDTFDLSTDRFRDDVIERILEKPMEKFEQAAEECQRVSDKLDEICDQQRRKLRG